METAIVNSQIETSTQEYTSPVETQVLPGKELDTSGVRKKYITEFYGTDTLKFLEWHTDLSDPANLILATNSRLNLLNQISIFKSVVNLNKINNIRHINKFFEAVNYRLPPGGKFIGCVETHGLRKKRIYTQYPFGLNVMIYVLDFMIKRIAPKLGITKRLYFFLTRGQNRLLSKAETLGRLISCGFEIVDLKHIDGRLYFVARKKGQPLFPEKPTYGPLIRLNRVGKNGKTIKVYKLRTMHPFSEYLQEYIYQNNKLEEGGKFKDDFRICTLGKFLRKYWLDELPMLLNFFRGDLKFVGVRPISRQYFNLYDEELKRQRIQYKPGLFPPYYADLPQTMEEILASERRYLEAYAQHPFKTDIRYFWKAFVNIVFKKARSS